MLNTITLILTILTLGFGVFTFCKFLSLQKELKNMYKTIEDFRATAILLSKKVQEVETKQKDHSAPTVDQSYYDSKTNTLVIKGNVEAEGWISAGKTNK